MLFLAANTRNLRPLQAQQILGNTPGFLVENAANCSVAPLARGEDFQAPSSYRKLSTLGPVFLQRYRVQCIPTYTGQDQESGKPKRVFVAWAGLPEPGLDSNDVAPGRPGMSTPVWVSCSCKYFRYVCEWALTRYGSSDIIHSNGQPAFQTNPSGIGLGCKHVYAALQYSMQYWIAESPEDKAVEEPDIEPAPQAPQVQPSDQPPEPPRPEPEVQEQIDELPTEEEVEVEDPRRAFYFPSYTQRLRTMALFYDTECC